MHIANVSVCMHCRPGDYGEYPQSAMYIPVSGLYYQQDPQVFSYCNNCSTDFET